MPINLNPIRHGLFLLVQPWGNWGGTQNAPFKISKTKNDLSMKLFSQFVCCRVLSVMWYDYDVVSMITPCKLRKLDIALAYQKSFGIAHIFVIYEFLVSHCYSWNKKTVTSKFNFYWENLNIDQVNTIFQISEKVRTNGPLTHKYKIFENKSLILKPWKILGILWKFHFLNKLSDQTKESTACTMCPHGE